MYTDNHNKDPGLRKMCLKWEGILLHVRLQWQVAGTVSFLLWQPLPMKSAVQACSLV